MPFTPMIPRLMRSLGAGCPALPSAEAGTMVGTAIAAETVAWSIRRRVTSVSISIL
jgi:hypothetical protein